MTTSRRPRVKICGITNAADARRSIALGAELIGLNFYPRSPRYIDPERAAALVSEVGRDQVLWVGVFVDEQIARAAEIADRVGLDLLQFHGDETPESIAALASRAIKVLRVRGDLTPELLDPWRDQGLWGLLIDARHETLFGGSGEHWNVQSLPAALGLELDEEASLRVLVAGGLEPSNVAMVAQDAHPWGVDLCSGVEAAPGTKDPELLERLFRAFSNAGLTAPGAMSPTSSSHTSFSHIPDEEREHGQTPSAA